jgi:hypothetical protein
MIVAHDILNHLFRCKEPWKASIATTQEAVGSRYALVSRSAGCPYHGQTTAILIHTGYSYRKGYSKLVFIYAGAIRTVTK